MDRKAIYNSDRATPDPSEPRTWLRRREVASLLRCSLQTVRNHEHRGLLTGKDVNGMHLFNPLEVEVLRAHTNTVNRTARCSKLDTRGDIEAAVYRMLDAGATRNEIVKLLHITADEAQRIWANYRVTEFDQADEQNHAAVLAAEIRELEHRREQKRLARMKRLRELLQATTGGNK